MLDMTDTGANTLTGTATSTNALCIGDVSFDENGNPLTSRGPHGITRHEYDVLGRLTKVTEPDGKWIAYEYDKNNNRTKMTTHSDGTPSFNHVTQYQYNDRNLLSKVYDQLAERDTNGDPIPTTPHTEYTYKDNGVVDTIVYANGTKAIHSYNGRNWLTSISNQKSDNTIIAQFVYSYDSTYWGKNGTRTQVVENILKPDGSRIQSTVAYTYDDLYRLAGEVRTGDLAYGKSYIYDAAGNRTRMVADGVQTDYTYDAANKMLTAGASSFTYDDKGNTLTETIGSIVTAYTWDFLNRLSQWQKTGQTTEAYLYNADGMRVRKTVGSTQTDFLLDMNEVAEEISGSNDASYVGPRLISEISGTIRTVYHADGVGSTRTISDNTQAVAQAAIYDAYGNLKVDYPASSAPAFGFDGQDRYLADATGLDYLKTRYYTPSCGVFVSRDPIGYRGGLNLYAYVGDNPANWVDPSGEMRIPGLGGASCAITCATALYQIGKYYAIMAGCKAGGLSGDDWWQCVWDQLNAENALTPCQNAKLAGACIVCLLARGWYDPPGPKPPSPIIQPGDPRFKLPPNPIRTD